MHNPDAAQLFETYLAAWNARDFARVAACFAEPAVFVLPHQSVSLPRRSDVVALLETIFAGLDAANFSHSMVESVTARTCGDGLAIVDARDVRRLSKNGELIESIDGHYVVQRVADSWRFAVVVVCTSGWQDD